VSTGLLISAPAMRDPNFARTVVLMCQHDEKGAIGLIISREGPVPVDEVLDRLELRAAVDYPQPTWWGGPVGTGTGFVVWRGEVPEEEGWNLGGGVAVSPSAERLAALARDGTDFELCLGYAGWSPGQLDKEIDEGGWLFTKVDATIVFDVAQADRYRAALASLGLSPDSFWNGPADA
jgi:putative transcriptional regulator